MVPAQAAARLGCAARYDCHMTAVKSAEERVASCKGRRIKAERAVEILVAAGYKARVWYNDRPTRVYVGKDWIGVNLQGEIDLEDVRTANSIRDSAERSAIYEALRGEVCR